MRSERKLEEDLISRLLEKKREPVCADETFCMDFDQCLGYFADYGVAYVKYETAEGASTLTVGLQDCCDKRMNWIEYLKEVKTVTSLAGVQPYTSRPFHLDGKYFKLTVQKIEYSSGELAVDRVCLEAM